MEDENSTPLVSIALCTFNGEKYLRKQLDSLVYQDYSNLEIVAIDDCSSDETWNILNEYSKQFSFIKPFQNEFNLGYIRNFERAVSMCTGEYIALADQDDIWELHKIRMLRNSIENHILIYHDSNIINEIGEPLNIKMSDIINLSEGSDVRPFLFMNCISGHSMFFKRGLIEKLMPFSGSCFHDWWIAYIAVNSGTIGLIKENLVHYRQHIGSTTDILKKKKEKGNNELHISTQKVIFKHLVRWKAYSNAENYNFINHLHKLMSKNSKLYSLELLVFLLRNMDSLLYISKKGFFSKLNYIRKLVRSGKSNKRLTMCIAYFILPHEVESIIHIVCD